MSDIKLEASKRTNTNAKSLLMDSILPWVVYWPSFESTPIQMDYQSFRKVFNEAGKSKTFVINIDWKDVNVLIKSHTVHPVKNTFEHIDFLAYDDDKVIVTSIPVELTGQSEAVKLWWILSQKLHTIKAKCLPKDIPESFTASIETLVSNESRIYVSELSNPGNIEMLVDQNQMVAWIILPRSAAAAAAADEEGEEGEETATEWEAWEEGDKWEKEESS